MLSKMKRAVRGRVGPVGLSLVAALVTAVAFAAVSVAKDDSGSKGSTDQTQGAIVGPGPGGPPQIADLSDEDKQKLEDFRDCMSDQGVEPPPAPPQPGKKGTFNRRMKPPSEAQREKAQKAFEACKDKLPEDAQAMGVPGCGPGGGPGGPHPGGAPHGMPPGQSGSGSNEDQSAPAPAPQGSTS